MKIQESDSNIYVEFSELKKQLQQLHGIVQQLQQEQQQQRREIAELKEQLRKPSMRWYLLFVFVCFDFVYVTAAPLNNEAVGSNSSGSGVSATTTATVVDETDAVAIWKAAYKLELANDYGAAAQLYERSAAMGCAMALYCLGQFFFFLFFSFV